MKATRGGFHVRPRGRWRPALGTSGPAAGRDSRFLRPRRPRISAVAVVVSVIVLLGAAGAAWQVHRQGAARTRGLIESAAAGYLDAWGRSNWPAMRAAVADPPPGFTRVNEQMFRALEVSAAAFTPAAPTIDGSAATVPFTARLELTGLGTWTYRGTLVLAEREDRWAVRWTPATIHPALRSGLHFVRTRQWADRAPILARDGSALTVESDVVTIGVVPGRVQDRRRVLDALQRYTGADPARVAALLDAPGVKPDWFVPVITLRMQRYQQVRPALYPVPGIFFRSGRGRILLQEGFAQQVVGRVGPATAEQLGRLGAPYEAGDVVGQYGLERSFERRLAGRPSGSIRLADSGGALLRSLASFDGVAPQPVRTTLDVGMQRAAEEAMAGQEHPAALVAVDTRTGEIRAAANRPVDGADRALDGRYPPGSTFKIVTAAALVEHGQTVGGPAECPPELIEGGKRFRNFEGEALGSITFGTAFAQSCNTAFIGLAAKLPNDALGGAARSFGFGTAPSLPVAAAGGQFPAPADDVERAAAAIGQGRVLASPLQMAEVAAAVASGAWHAPRLVSTDPASAPKPLPEGVPDALRTLMRLVVTEGTGTAANVPGPPVFGKTGTAEFGTAGDTHAWFVGFRGQTAFAVAVEGGGVGGRVAAPIAASFLRKL